MRRRHYRREQTVIMLGCAVLIVSIFLYLMSVPLTNNLRGLVLLL